MTASAEPANVKFWDRMEKLGWREETVQVEFSKGFFESRTLLYCPKHSKKADYVYLPAQQCLNF